MAIKTLKGCGVLKLDDTIMDYNEATNVVSVKDTKLVKDIAVYVSIPTTYSTLADARLIDEKLRNAMIIAGIMEAE